MASPNKAKCDGGEQGMRGNRIVVTEDLIRRANQAAIDKKKFSKEIEEAAASRPRLTSEEINRVWAKVNGTTQANHEI